MSPPEVKLWAFLRRSPAGIKFRRQHPIGPYVADFYCAHAKLVIEVDGAIHGHGIDHDEVRDTYLRGLDLTVIRIPAADVLRDPQEIADGLVKLCGPSTTQLR